MECSVITTIIMLDVFYISVSSVTNINLSISRCFTARSAVKCSVISLDVFYTGSDLCIITLRLTNTFTSTSIAFSKVTIFDVFYVSSSSCIITLYLTNAFTILEAFMVFL